MSNCDPDGIRTHDSLIKSEVLYQLSYEVILLTKNNQNSVFNLSLVYLPPTLPDQLTVMGCFGLHPRW